MNGLDSASQQLAEGPPTAVKTSSTQPTPTSGQKNFLMGQMPNPNLLFNHHRPNKRGQDGGVKAGSSGAMLPPVASVPAQTASLASYLLTQSDVALTAATQQPFLFHAGCGILGAVPMNQWLAQDSHLSRGYIAFVGQLIGKIRLPIVANTQSHPLYRAMDLLISALNNVRREMSFFEITATKHNLQLPNEEPSPITRSFLDLLVSSSAPAASLLEGAVVLWTVEHCYRASWDYAASFTSSSSQPIFPLSSGSDSHRSALHQSLILNWTSPAFAKFVDACRAVVDELANAETSPNGREQMSRCQSAFNQVLWLWERTWPEVHVIGEENELTNAQHAASSDVGSGSSIRCNVLDSTTPDEDDDDCETRQESVIGRSSCVRLYNSDKLPTGKAANNA